jgi:hypothetical protein
MTGIQKVLVIDNGERAADSALSAELACMGLASVTAPVDAAADVLAMMPSPAAVVLQIPREADWSERKRFLNLAERFRTSLAASNVPVVVINGTAGSGTHARLLETEIGTRILSRPEL